MFRVVKTRRLRQLEEWARHNIELEQYARLGEILARRLGYTPERIADELTLAQATLDLERMGL